MKKSSTWTCLAYLLFCSSIALGQDAVSSTLSNEQGDQLSYTLYRPSGYDVPGNEFPFVMFFGSEPQQSLIDTVRGDEFPAFLLAAGSEGRGFARPSEELGPHSTMAVELIEQLKVEYESIDPDRLIATGWSSGGFGAFDVVYKRPNLFDAVVPLAAGYSPDRIAPDVRTWAFHGREDSVVDAVATRVMLEALAEAGADPLYLDMKRSHAIPDDVYALPELYDWMFHGVTPPTPSLTYNPANGNLTLDATDSTEAVWSFTLFSSLPLNDPLVTELGGVDLRTTSSLLFYRADMDSGFNDQVDFGNVLPPGLNYVTFPAAVNGQFRLAGSNATHDFIVRVVPEPGGQSIAFCGISCCIIACRRRRRRSR